MDPNEPAPDDPRMKDSIDPKPEQAPKPKRRRIGAVRVDIDAHKDVPETPPAKEGV